MAGEENNTKFVKRKTLKRDKLIVLFIFIIRLTHNRNYVFCLVSILLILNKDLYLIIMDRYKFVLKTAYSFFLKYTLYIPTLIYTLELE